MASTASSSSLMSALNAPVSLNVTFTMSVIFVRRPTVKSQFFCYYYYFYYCFELGSNILLRSTCLQCQTADCSARPTSPSWSRKNKRQDWPANHDRLEIFRNWSQTRPESQKFRPNSATLKKIESIFEKLHLRPSWKRTNRRNQLDGAASEGALPPHWDLKLSRLLLHNALPNTDSNSNVWRESQDAFKMIWADNKLSTLTLKLKAFKNLF